jgi:D-amino-acid dehydrogenase
MLCKTQHAREEEAKTAEHARRLGVLAEVLDAGKTAALDLDVDMDVAGSVYFPMDCHLSPNRLMAWLLREVHERGGEVRWQRECIGWRKQNGRLVAAHTSRGDMAADEFVICGGSWSGLMARALNLRLPLQAGKGYSLTLAKPRQLPKICAILTEARVAVTPIGTGLRFGGTMEIAGLDETINARRVRGIIHAIPQYYPRFQEDDFADLKPWCGLRPCSPDGLPYLGRTRAWQNLIIATGHAMMGVSLGPITGKIVADILANGRPSMDLSLLSPDRFDSAKETSSRPLD